MNIGIIILAAGSSSRLGKRKQLLPFHSDTLLNYAIDQAILSISIYTTVILGFEFEKIKKTIHRKNLNVLINEDWKSGMASSIQCGIRQARKEKWDGAIITVCDQVFLTSNIYDEIIIKAKLGHGIIASRYQEGSGPPCYFSHLYFEELDNLKGERGAFSLVRKHEKEVTFIDFPKGNIDIDKDSDLHFLSGEDQTES